MFSDAAAGGTLFPLVGHALLAHVGCKGTILTLGSIFAVGNGLALLFVEHRVPVAPVVSAARRTPIDYTFLTMRGIWAMRVFVIISAMGNLSRRRSGCPVSHSAESGANAASVRRCRRTPQH